MKKKRNNNFLIILINDLYNFYFKFFNNIRIDLLLRQKDEKKYLSHKKIRNLKHSTSLQTVWLLNLRRLYNIFKNSQDTNNYHFIDVGCGNGIPLIYAYKKLKFKSYIGFDLIKNYVDISKKNIISSIGVKNDIKIYNLDACRYYLDTKKKYFVFMYNLFDEIILNKFIKNNLTNLIKNNSYLAYANLVENSKINILKKYSKKFVKIEKYKIYLFKF
tara:strand:+ start:8299 stop:8949 length:651 start_codon:yes stop_codon:yes gene_type:complete